MSLGICLDLFGRVISYQLDKNACCRRKSGKKIHVPGTWYKIGLKLEKKKFMY